MSVNAEINDYTIRVTYAGDRESPFDPNDMRCNVVKIVNNLTQQQTILRVWRDAPKDKTDVLHIFWTLLQSCMFGALDPPSFCSYLGLDPNHPKTPAMFHHHRETAARLATIIINRDELLKTMKLLQQKLGIRPNPNKVNGS